jgi:hypothetical protein
MIDTFLSGEGMLRADWALTVLLAAASAMSWWAIAFRGHSVGLWMVALGFSLLATRMAATLIFGGDPPISPVGIISLSLISLGWVLYVARRRRCAPKVAPAVGWS